ncbi:hypothetical protein FM104_00325 [Microbacterium esteraromaticum]|uniref:Uncharacterized protein n=1 Tax=Microbacterium esteraromaticum TaxID=57043 RepID=A0A1R4I7B4_9MICO|nr:hypothetical protein [Microbacterium esteraromaticum]SJN15504.1 hypothetical protein FM104_00325 [Microbacterium esteraromaticum]
MTRPRYKRTPTETDQAPVMLPSVVMTVAEDGTMTVTVDGERHLPEPFAPPWRREAFAAILDTLTSQRSTPVRVEVREADGTVFTDIIVPTRRRQPAPELGTSSAAVPAVTAPTELQVVQGEGFVPGEDVAVAVILTHSDAAHNGTARGLLTPKQVASSPTREAILFGRISGTLTVVRLR